MDSLTDTFNRIFEIDMFPLWIFLILDIGKQQKKRRRKRTIKLAREFNAKAMNQSRDRYRRQVAQRCTLRP